MCCETLHQTLIFIFLLIVNSFLVFQVSLWVGDRGWGVEKRNREDDCRLIALPGQQDGCAYKLSCDRQI